MSPTPGALELPLKMNPLEGQIWMRSNDSFTLD